MVFVPCSMYVRTKQYPQGKLLLALPVVWAQKERCSKESASVVPMLPPCPTDCTPRTAPWWVVLGAYVSSMSASPEITVATVDALDSYRGPVRAKITGTGPDGTTGSWWHVLLIGAKDAQVCQFLWRNVTPITIYLRIRGYSSGSYSTSSDWKSLSFS